MLSRRHLCDPLALAGLLAFLAAGCIVSGQFVIVINLADFTLDADDPFEYAEVDLTDDNTWNKHKDDIQNIVDIKFEMTIVNDAGTIATGEVYISKSQYTNISDVTQNATLVLSGIVVQPRDSRKVSFSESGQFITHLDKLLELTEEGQFWVYGLAKERLTIHIESGARLLVTFSAG